MFDASEDSEASVGENIPGGEPVDGEPANDGYAFEADETEDVETESDVLIIEETTGEPDSTDENAASEETAADGTEQPSEGNTGASTEEVVGDLVEDFVPEGDSDELPTEDSEDEEPFFIDEEEWETVSYEAMYNQEEQNGLFNIYSGTDSDCYIDNQQIITYQVDGNEVHQAKANDYVTVVCDSDSRYTLVRLTLTYGDVTEDLNLESPTFTMPAADVNIRARFTNRGVHSGSYGFKYIESHGSSSIAQVNGQYALSANAGDMVYVYVTEPYGWIYGGVTVTYGSTTLNLDAYESFQMPAEEVTITPVLSQAHTGKYNIRVNGGPGGGGYAYVNDVRAISANENETVVLQINSNYGYTLTGATVSYNDGTTETLSADNMSFAMPACDVTVTPTFSESQGGNPYIIKTSSNGPIQYNLLNGPAVAGNTMQFTIVAGEGWNIDSVSASWIRGNLGLDFSDGVYSLVMPEGDVTINVTLTNNSGQGGSTDIPVDTYSVAISNDITNGSVSSDKNEASVGETVTLSVTPNSGYELDTLTVMGPEGEIDVSENGTFVMPGGNVTVSATFKQLESTAAVPIDEEHFPDEALRAYVFKNFDSDENNILSAEEIKNAQYIDLQGEWVENGHDQWGNVQWVKQPKVTTLKGIEYLTELNSLYVANNELTDADIAVVSGLTKLETLICSDNNLTSVDVSALTNLQSLDISNNSISKLDVSALTNLQSLNISNNSISELDVSALTNLQFLDISNNSISELDVSALTNLQFLNIFDNSISELDVSALTNLQFLYISNNSISKLDVSALANLEELSAPGNQITTLDVSHNPKLRSLYVAENSILELDISNCPKLVGIIDDQYLSNDWGEMVSYVKEDEYEQTNLTIDPKTKVIAGDKVIEPSAIAIDSSLFPDPALRQYVEDFIDRSNGTKDGYLTKDEISRVNYIQLGHYDLEENGYPYNLSSVTGLGVSDLTGLEIFTNLINLNVANNNLTAIDVSAFSSLQLLDIRNNNIASFDITPCPIIAAIVNDENRSSETMYPSLKRSISYSCNDNDGNIVSVRYDSDTKLMLNGEEVKVPEIALNAENFPDDAFRAELSYSYDRDKNGVLSETELDSINNMLSIYFNSGIESLKGIELFKGLKTLNLYRLTGLKSLDLSQNTNLNRITLDHVRGITELDVSALKKLSRLTVDNCGIEKLTLGQQPYMDYVSCSGNKFKSLDISGCSQTLIENVKQENYKLYNNDSIVHYESTQQQQYGGSYTQMYLICDADVQITGGNPVAPVDLPEGIAIDENQFPDEAFRQYVLDEIDNGDGELSTAEIFETAYIDLYSEEKNSQTGQRETKPLGVRSLAGIEVFTELEGLDSTGNPLTKVDLSKNTKLRWLYLQDDQIEELDISGCTELENLDCNGTKLKSLDLTNNKKLVSLYCMYNEELTSLNISGLTKLERAYVSYNALKGLDASNLPKLFKLDCRGNGMTTLDVSNDKALLSLLCDGNAIEEVDITSCPDYIALLKGSYVVINDGVTVYEDYNVGTGDDSDFTSTHMTCDETMAIIGLTAATRYNINVDMPEDSHGEVSVVGKASQGTTVRVTVDPEAYYECAGVTVRRGNTALTVNRVDENTFTFTMPAGDVTVSAAFALIAFDIVSVTDPSDVTVTADPVSATIGETVELTLTPGANRVVTGVKVMFGDEEVNVTENEGKYTFTMPGGDVEVTALFKRVPQVTAPEAIALVYNGKDQKLVSAASTDGGTLKYSLDGENWSDEVPTGKDAGSYTVYYKVEGNDEYTDAASAEAEASIAKKALTITARDKTKTIGTDDPKLEYDCNGLVTGDVLNGALSRVEGEDVGSYDIIIGTLSAGDNYQVTFNGAKLEIISQKITVVAKAQTKVYGDNDPELNYTVIGVTDEKVAMLLNGSLTREAGKNVGQYAITQGTLKAPAGYELNFVGAKLTITPKPLTVTAEDVSKTYGESDPDLTYTASDLEKGDELTGALTRETGENVGKYAIDIGTLDAGDNYTVTFESADLTITPKPLTVTAEAVSKTYGESDPKLTYTASDLEEGDELTGALTRDEGENVGEYAIQQGTLKASDNYTMTFVPANLTIEKRNLTITADAKAKLLDEADPVLTYTVTGLAQGDVAEVTLTRDTGEGVGEYSIMLDSWSVKKGEEDVTGCYAQTFNGANLTIGNNVINVTAKAASKAYGTEDPELEYEADIPDGGALTGALSRVKGENAGTYAITQGTLQPNEGYVLNFVGANLTIDKADLTVTPDDQEKTYGDADPELTYTVSGLVNDDVAETVLTGALSREKGENAGAYAILQGTLAANNNYTLNFAEGKALTIAKKALTITAKDAEKTYGENDPDFEYEIEGLAGEDALHGAILTRAEGEDAGTYAIAINDDVIEELNFIDNYDVTFNAANLTINKKALTITADNSGNRKVYGADDPELSYTVKGLVEGDEINTDTKLGRVEGETVGSYAYDTSAIEEEIGKNYDITVEGRFIITPKPIEVIWDTDTKMVYNGHAQKPTATVDKGALVGNDTCQVIVETRKDDETIETVDAGTYENTAVAVSLTNPNYTFGELQNRVLESFTIEKASANGKISKYPGTVAVNYEGVTDGKLDLSAYLTDADSVIKIEPIQKGFFEEGSLKIDNGILTYAVADLTGSDITGTTLEVYIKGKNYDYGDEPALMVTFKTGEVFTLRFNTDGGTQEKNARLRAGESISKYLPEKPTKDGYTFDKWYSDPEKTVEVVEGEGGTKMGAADATLYANWIPNKYSISLKGGTAALPDKDVDDKTVDPNMVYTVENAAFNLPVLPDTKGTPDYTFLGWLPEGADEDAMPQIDVTIDPADHPADASQVITYVAQWRVGALAGTVKFDNASEGSNLKGIQGMKEEASTEEGTITPLAKALKEVAAQQSEESAETKVTVNMDIAVADESGEQAQKIIEKFTETETGIERKSDFIDIDIRKTTETFDSEGTSQGDKEDVAVTNTDRVMEIPLEYDMTGLYNFTIMRAHDKEDGTTEVDTFTKLKSKPKNPSDGTFYVSGQGSNAVVHIYTDKFCTFCGTGTTSGEHEVTFLMEAGSDVVYETAQKSVENGQTVEIPKDPVKPTKDGIAYRFDGWREEDKSTAYDFSTPVYGDVTLVGMWKEMREAKVSVRAEYNATYDGKEHKIDAPTIDEDVEVYFSTEKALSRDNAADEGVTYDRIFVKDVGTTTIYWYAIGDNVKPSVENGTILYTISKKQTAPSSGDKASAPAAPATTASASTASAPAAPAASEPVAESIPTIISTKKSVKATVEVGKVYQIDLVNQSLVGKKYKSSKKKIATVSGTGLVTPKKAGKTKITFKVGKKKRTITLKVVDPTVPKGIQLNATSLTVKKGETQTLTYTLLPEGIAKSNVTWKTSNKKVATVKNGVVTFKKKGKVTITAITKSGKKKAKVKFTVTN